MQPSSLRLAFALSLALCGASAAAIRPEYKQLAGPPSEFDAMRPVGIGAAAIVSKSALIALKFSPDAQHGRSWTGTLPVENGRAHFMVLSGNGASLQVELRSADGKPTPLSKDAGSATGAEFGIDAAAYHGDVYALDALPAGAQTITIHSGVSGSDRGFLLMEGDPSTQLVSYPGHNRQWVGQRMQIAAVLSHTNADGSSQLGKAAGTIVRATLHVTAPDGTQHDYPMLDDGRHGDALANDGVYGAEFDAQQAGDYLAHVETESVGRNGEHQLRSAEHIVSIVQPSVKMASDQATGISPAPGRLEISIPATETATSHGHYRIYGEVWGTDASGKAVPVAWISGMSERSGAGFPLGLDERWITRAQARAPFELRNVRIEDPDYFVTLATASKLALSLPPIPQGLATQGAPDEAMTSGPRPQQTTTAASGSRLLLVHGYCSSLVWPQAQFRNSAVFSDQNQNRTNDQFAQLILAFGSSWHDYGIVAHSQGGLASLHLYTYYWSGLDYVTSGSRLIQSVGSPYQGTNIAGILASIGSWFGEGCGSNSDLTYSGASAWLAGIPKAERAQVNYYTTSFTVYAWTWNDCEFATELVLSDPNDGVTEKVNDQLPGGVNRGHVTGECHTTGMNFPAQYLDSARNATMSADAAR